MATKPKHDPNTIADNRRARFDYEILDTYEAGVMLEGSEVKSIRNGAVQINEAYVSVMGHEIFLIGAHIAKYANAGYAGHTDERRTRKLLLHAKEITNLKKEREAQGCTLIPLKLYWKNNRVKLRIGVAKGKKQHDKRASIKERDWNRQKQRMFKG